MTDEQKLALARAIMTFWQLLHTDKVDEAVKLSERLASEIDGFAKAMDDE